jgi:prophage tail gpP-like protein
MLDELKLGGDDDVVRLRLGGTDVRIAESYDVHMSVLQQPAAFTLRLGWGKTAAELLALAAPGTKFELLIAGQVIQSGRVDSRGVPGSAVTEVEIKGRDFLASLYDAFVEEEISLNESTYETLTRRVLDIVGLTEEAGHFLEINNDANRELIGRVKVAVQGATEKLDQIETGTSGGSGKMVYQSLKAKLGERWLDLLTRHYKLAGLFLWCGGDGRIILARPRANQPAIAKLVRRRGDGGEPPVGNVLNARLEDNTAMRHSAAIVYGRYGSAATGRKKARGEMLDPEMIEYGLPNKIVTIYDEDVTNKDEAEYVARRTIAEEHREGWTLEYTVSGHTTESLHQKGDSITWIPDTVVQVEDNELGIAGDFYLESVTYRRSPHTTTTLKLMRAEDLVFAKDEEIHDKKMTRKLFGQTK